MTWSKCLLHSAPTFTCHDACMSCLVAIIVLGPTFATCLSSSLPWCCLASPHGVPTHKLWKVSCFRREQSVASRNAFRSVCKLVAMYPHHAVDRYNSESHPPLHHARLDSKQRRSHNHVRPDLGRLLASFQEISSAAHHVSASTQHSISLPLCATCANLCLSVHLCVTLSKTCGQITATQDDTLTEVN